MKFRVVPIHSLLISLLLVPSLGLGTDSHLPLCQFEKLLPSEQAAVVSKWQRTKKDGVFVVATPEEIEMAEAKYLADKMRPNGLATSVYGIVERFERDHLDIDFHSLSNEQLLELKRAGLRRLEGGESDAHSTQYLIGTPYEQFSSLYYFTSGAGLWSRGGGVVKALLPLNLKEIITSDRINELTRAGQIVAAKSPEAVAKLDGYRGKLTPREVQSIRVKAVATISEITEVGIGHSGAINVLDLKIANIALLSQLTQSYIHLDIWTSEQTHEPIARYLENLKLTYSGKHFHPDPETNAEVREAIGQYFMASEQLGETLVFGYQEGFYPLDPVTGKSQKNHPPIGEGAGMAKHYLDKSGRTALLKARGIKDWVFQNIEVSSDLALEYAAYKRSNMKVAGVMVPTREGYFGGSPYRVIGPDSVERNQLLESSAVADELKKGNGYFNANTIFQSIHLSPPKNVGYEAKNSGTSVRLKMNAGDITLEEDAAMIGGRVGYEYENFKSYTDYLENGIQAIRRMQELWGSM